MIYKETTDCNKGFDPLCQLFIAAALSCASLNTTIALLVNSWVPSSFNPFHSTYIASLSHPAFA
jgi:hypothetical protein